jgi:hypothetical protein
MAIRVVTLKEIEKIFAILESLSISREAVTIPLGPKHPGSVKRLLNGKIEIIVDSEVPIDDWLPELEVLLRKEVES